MTRWHVLDEVCGGTHEASTEKVEVLKDRIWVTCVAQDRVLGSMEVSVGAFDAQLQIRSFIAIALYQHHIEELVAALKSRQPA